MSSTGKGGRGSAIGPCHHLLGGVSHCAAKLHGRHSAQEMSELPPAMPALPLTRLDSRTPFHDGAAPLGFVLAEFWAWNGSDLVGNTLRGALAEFLVARALGIRTEVRDEWNAWDLETAAGLRIEVKCSGYVQTWAQKDFSEPSFGIARRAGWTRTLAGFSKRQARWSDVFVFALHHHRDKPSADPLDLTQWRFLAMPTSTLDAQCVDQKTIAPGALERMGGEWVSHSELRTSFDRVVGCMPAPVRAPDDPAR